MNQRENLLRAMSRKGAPEFVPYHFTLCDSQKERMKAETGTDDYERYFDLSARFISIAPTRHKNDYSRYHSHLPEKAFIDEWGVGQEPGSIAHFTRMYHPMEGFESPEEVYEYPYPDMLEDYRWEPVCRQVEKAHEDGAAAVFMAVQVFEPAWYLRGMEQLMMDMLCDEEMAKACLERMTQFQEKITRRAVRAGMDIIVFGDDVGSQRDMMMAPQLWRKWLKPTMSTVIAAAKEENPQVLAYYHSDGVISPIIRELIEIGVDILNPVQPECMDPAEVKRLYGDKLSFWGTVGTQTTMPFGTPEEVRRVVKERIETVGAGGGLCLAPTHLLEPEVPWENIVAFVEAAREFGKY